MSNEILLEIQEFHDACRFLLKRQFGQSMSSAKKVLSITNEQGSIEQNVKAIHLIVDINNTLGRYQNKPSLFHTSLEYLEEILAQPSSIYPKEYLWETLLEKVKTLLLLGEYQEAEKFLLQCMKEEVLLEKSECRKVYLLLAFSELHYLRNEYDAAVGYTTSAFRFLEDKDRDDLLLEVYAQTIKSCIRRHEYSKVFEYGTKTLELSRKYKDGEREFVGLNAIAIYHGHGSQHDFRIAMLYFRNALDKSTEINFRYGICHSMVNIGTIYANLYNYDDALNRYTAVLEQYNDVLDDNTEIIILNNIGNIYFVMGELDKALEYFERSLALTKSINYTEMLAHTMAQISRTLAAKGEYQNALDCAFESEKIIEESGNEEGRQINLITLGNIYYKLKDFGPALKYTEKGIVQSKEVEDKTSEIRGYRLMSNIFKEKGDFEKALEYQLIYTRAQDEQTMGQQNHQIIDVEIRYDIQQKEKEIELLKKYKNKLSAQHDKIVEQNEQLRAANNDLMQFAYAVSHDLKEPLRMIGSYSQLIQRRYVHQLDPSSGEFFGYVNEGVSRMTQLLSDLLKYAIVGKGDGQGWEEVKLEEILEITKFNLKLVIDETQASIVSNKLPTIFTNKAYMSQLFQNLISNAIKFKKDDEASIIKVEYKREGKEHSLTFKDNGIGIPKEALSRIFVIFQRLHRRGGYEGTGIGLSICTKIIDRLGGKIFVESEEGVGSQFTIILPDKPPSFLKENNSDSFFLDEGF